MKRKRDVRKTNNETLQKAAAGDKAAIAEVFAEVDYLARWWATKHGSNRGTIDDLHSVARLAVFDALRTYKPGKGNWAGWVTQWMKARIWAHNRGAQRRNKRETPDDDADAPDVAESAQQRIERAQTSLELREAIAKLPRYLQRVMQGRLEGRTLQSIGDEVGRSRERVRQLEKDGLALLRRTMEAA